MSTGADCQFEERKPDKWWYRLQRWPYGENPDYDEFGPFVTEELALDHLSDHHANPGGHCSTPYVEYVKFGPVNDI